MKSDAKTVIVTGATSGIGLMIAENYLKHGYNVVGNGRSAAKVQKSQSKENLFNSDSFVMMEGDISLPQTSKKLFEIAVHRFGKVDILVNNAGIFKAKPVTDYTIDELDALINTNLKGFFYTTQEAARHMIPNKSGHIVSISASIAIQPLQNVPASAPILIKGGINQTTKALALELAPHNIKVSAVAPGIVDTPLYSPEMHGFLNTLQPAGRIGTTKEIADAVMYLTNSDFTTGIILPVDGGMSSGKW